MEECKDAKILIVDDQKHNRELVKFFLQQAGFCQFFEANSAESAISQALQIIPDLIFLDIQLGDDSGFDVCKTLKANPKSVDIPILFLSSFTETENKVIGYKLGAVDFVDKPINHYEILARTKVHLKNGQLLRQLQTYQKRMSNELERAKETQNAILPSSKAVSVIENKHHLQIESTFRSSSELAGDYWSVFELDSDNIIFVLADFSGHGVYSALNTVRIDLLLAQAEKDILQKPKDAIKYLNKELYKILPAEDFCSIIYMVLNTKTGDAEYTGVNTPDIYLLKQNGEEPIPYSVKGFPLSFSKNIQDEDFTYNSLKLNHGDAILFYSDALLEEQHKDGSRWLDNGLIKVLKEVQQNNINDKFNYILDKFDSSVKTPLTDDLTVVCLTRK